MKNTQKTTSHNRSQVFQAAIIALVVACSSVSTRARAVEIPEGALESEPWRLPVGDLGQPININGELKAEASAILAPLMNVKGEAMGVSAPLGKALPPISAPPVQLRRAMRPESAKAPLVLRAIEEVDAELAPPLALSVERETYRFSFGQSQNCRRFDLVCSLIGIP